MPTCGLTPGVAGPGLAAGRRAKQTPAGAPRAAHAWLRTATSAPSPAQRETSAASSWPLRSSVPPAPPPAPRAAGLLHPANGIALTNGFGYKGSDGEPPAAFVFSSRFGGAPRGVADTASHELGALGVLVAAARAIECAPHATRITTRGCMLGRHAAPAVGLAGCNAAGATRTSLEPSKRLATHVRRQL